MISNAEYFSQLRDLEDQYAASEITRAELIAAQVALADLWAVPATLAAQVVDFTDQQRTVLDQIGLLNLTGTVASVGDLPGGASNSDTYVVTNNGHAYIRLTGVWKDLGVYGGRGGISVFPVEGPPDADLGIAGDVAVDMSAGDFYGPKTSDGWGDPILASGIQTQVEIATAAQEAAVSARDQAEGFAIASDSDAISAGAGLQRTYPNLFAEAAVDLTAAGNTSGSAAIAAGTHSGLPCWVLTSATNSFQSITWDFPIALFGGAAHFSAGLRVLDISASTSARLAELLLVQFNGATELARETIQLSDGAAMATETVFGRANVAIDPTCTFVRFLLRANSPAAGPRTIKFRDPMMAAGPVATFRRPPPARRATDAEAVAGTLTGVYLDPASAKAARIAGQVPLEDSLGLVSAQPNQFTRGEIDTTTALRLRTSTAAPVATTYDGRACWSIVSINGSNSDATAGPGPFLKSAMGNPAFISACVEILGIEAAGVGATGAALAKLYLQQFDVGGSEITGARATLTPVTTETLTVPKFFRFEGVAVHADAVSFGLFIAINGGSQAARHLYFTNLMIAAGKSAIFRAPHDSLSLSSAATETEAVAGTSAVKFMSPEGSAAARSGTTEMALGLVDKQPNLFTADELDFIDSPRLVTLGRVTATTLDNVPCGKITTLAGQSETTGVASYKIPRPEILGSVFSYQFRILKVDAAASGTNIARVLILQYNGSSEISATRITINIETAAGAGRATPKTFRGEGIALHADCTEIRMFFGINSATASNDRSVWFRDMLIAAGPVSTFRRPPRRAGGTTLYLSPTGSDTASGSATAPLASFDRALALNGGVGIIALLPGDYPPIKIDAAKVVSLDVVGLTNSDGARPVFRYGTRATGITKTAGQTKIYEFAITIPEGQPNWIWQDNVNDLTTAIAANEQHALTRGRAYRLPCVRGRKTAATTLAAAKTEMDATADPRCFYDPAGLKMYFTIQGGSDATSANIYVASGADAFDLGLISNPPLFWSGGRNRLRIGGIDIRYGNLNLRPFRDWEVADVCVLGAPGNCFDFGFWGRAWGLEACGAGSGFATNGDGLNAHNFTRWDYSFCWSHDNNDDGESPHEGCVVRGSDSVMEYNGGNGVIPGSGGRGYYSRITTRKNALTSAKYGGFAAIGSEGSYLEAVDCVSIDERYAFYDTAVRAGSASMLITRNCLAIGSTVEAFGNTRAEDCRVQGVTGLARHVSTVVNTSTPLA